MITWWWLVAITLGKRWPKFWKYQRWLQEKMNKIKQGGRGRQRVWVIWKIRKNIFWSNFEISLFVYFHRMCSLLLLILFLILSHFTIMQFMCKVGKYFFTCRGEHKVFEMVTILLWLCLWRLNLDLLITRNERFVFDIFNYQVFNFAKHANVDERYVGQSIQEWTKWNLWKTAFKKFKWYGLLKQTIITSKFLKTVFHKFHLVHSWILCPICDIIFFLTNFPCFIITCFFIFWPRS